MTLEFDVSFQRAVAGVMEYQARLQNLGSEMDRLEQGGQKLASAYKPLFQAIRAHTEKASLVIGRLTKDQELAGNSARAMQQHMEKSFAGISNGYLQASVRAEAFRTNLSGLRNVLADTRAHQQFYNTQVQIATALTDAANKSDLARARRDVLTTSTGRAQVAEEELLRAQRRRLVEEQRAIAMSDAHVRAYREREQAQRQAAQAAAHYAQMLAQATAAQREMAVTGESLAWGYQVLTQRQAELAAQQERARAAVDAHNRAMIEGEQNLHRYTGANAEAERAARRLADTESRAASRRAQELAQLRQAMEARDRADKAYRETATRVAEATRTIGAAEARTTAERERAVRGTAAYNAALVRAATAAQDAESSGRGYWLQLRRLNQAIMSSSADRLNQQFVHLARSGHQATSSLQALTRHQAALRSSEEQLTSTLRLRNNLTLEQARANQVLTSSEARLSDAVRRQTEEYKRRAQYAQMTNMQLLGMSRGVDKLSRDMHMNAQAAAMFRAALGGMNASIGIYTSSTVLAASATYAFAAALRNTVTTGMEFTETMSRAEAVMMTGIDAITTSGRSMEGLEMQVRALGASTIFTATEVAGGLVELGMAGLSANQALTALKPTLDLASIGAIEMSEAADIATNVMTSFKLAASDLSEVVDILSMAVTNSNTTISQLANALSYVGPAAEAAGFDLRDTVAAIELLSNAGIKASRAGTGLRRFMLNIQNPTAKGAAVLERYGIALDDAEGNTRDLMDILGQFNQALHRDGIAPSERMAAIVDLVGVRAASAVSRMVGSVGELGVLRRQLDDVAGAAEEMRQKIEDNLTADWKQVKSAFQDLQLEVFQEFQWHMRETAASMTLFFRQLTEEGPDGISRLDELIATAHQAVDVLKVLGITFVGFKSVSILTTMVGALGANVGKASAPLSVYSQRLGQAAAQQTALGTSTASTSALLNLQNAVLVRTTSTVGTLSGALSVGATHMSRYAMAASMVGKALGWAGVVYGIYQAISTAFGGTTGYLEDHQARVEEMEKRYKSLNQEIEKTQHAATQGALEKHAENLRTELDGIIEMIAHYGQVAAANTDSDLIQTLEDRLFMLRQSARDTGQALVDNLKAQGELGVSQDSLGKSRRGLDELVAALSESEREAASLRDRIDEISAAAQGMRDAGHTDGIVAEYDALIYKLSRVEEQIGRNRDRLRDYRREVEEVEQATIRFTDQLQRALEQQGKELDEAARVDRLSVTEALIEANQRLADVRAEVAEMDAQGADRSLGVYKLAEERALAAQEEVAELMAKYIELSDTAIEAREELAASRRSDKENADLALKALKELNAELLVMQAMAKEGAIVDVERLAEVLNQIRQNESTLRSYQASQDRDAERAATEARRAAERAAQEEERRIQQQMTAFQSLRAEYDKIGEAVRQYHDQQKSLKSLLDAGRIGAEDYADAMRHLRLRLHETTLEHDKHYQALTHLQEAYLTSPFEDTLDDLVELNRLLREGAVSLEHYGRIMESVQDRQEEEAIAGMPKADIGGLGGAASTPFGEYISTVTDYGEGLAKYRERGTELDDGRLLEQERIQREAEQRISAMEAEVTDREEHARRLEKLKQDEKDALLAVEEKYAHQSAALMDERAKYAEASAEMVKISMVGSLSEVFGMVASVGEDATNAQKAAFIAQKALAVAQILMYTHLAAARAPAEAGPILGIPLATMITAQGYASAGLVAGLAIGQVSGAYDGGGGGGGGNYAGMYDKGGHIPSGKWGIVGEYGPEIVKGPANVTGREATARKLGGGNSLTIAPEIHVTVEGGGGGGASHEEAARTGQLIGKQVENQILGILHREMRPNGVLERWKRS